MLGTARRGHLLQRNGPWASLGGGEGLGGERQLCSFTPSSRHRIVTAVQAGEGRGRGTVASCIVGFLPVQEGQTAGVMV